jgi:hypothetical protein
MSGAKTPSKKTKATSKMSDRGVTAAVGELQAWVEAEVEVLRLIGGH